MRSAVQRTGARAPETVQADPVFERTAERIIRLLVQHDPVQATRLGLHGKNDAQLPEHTPEALESSLDELRGILKELDLFDPQKLAPEQAIDLQLARGYLGAQVEYLERRPPWKVMPQAYLRDPVYGLHVLAIRDFAPVPVRARALLGRLRAMPPLLRRGMQNLENPPAVFTETAVLCARGAMGFFDGILRQFIAGVDDATLRHQCERAAGEAYTSIQVYTEFLLSNLMPRSRGEFRIGKPLFNRLLRDQHRIPFDADELVVLGEKVYHETLREVRATAGQIRPGFNWTRLLLELKQDHPASDGLVAAYAGSIEAARRFVRERDLLGVPEGESLEVVDTPGFARPIHPYVLYVSSGPFEKEERGILWVTPVEPGTTEERRAAILEGHSRWGIPVLAMHEGFPGHHLQSTLAGRHPRKLRSVFTNPVFSEGWALYCEEMMHEQGFYADDRIRLVQLQDQLWRACRVIVDVELHTGKMSYNDAVGFLVRKAKLERPHAMAEVRRYCAHPTQPMSYVVGKLLLKELREDCRAWRGDGFTLRGFHDDLLSHGTLPIDLLRTEMGIPRRCEESTLFRALTRTPRPPRAPKKPGARSKRAGRISKA